MIVWPLVALRGVSVRWDSSKSLEASARLRSNTGLHAERTWGDSNPRPRARLSPPVKRHRSVSTGGKPWTPPRVLVLRVSLSISYILKNTNAMPSSLSDFFHCLQVNEAANPTLITSEILKSEQKAMTWWPALIYNEGQWSLMMWILSAFRAYVLLIVSSSVVSGLYRLWSQDGGFQSMNAEAMKWVGIKKWNY